MTLLALMAMTETALPSPSPERSLFRKALDVLLGMSLVNLGNYAINVVYGRYLESSALGDAILVTTFLLLTGAISTGIQTATARVVASGDSEQQGSDAVNLISKAALAMGAILMLAFIGLATPLSAVLNVAEPSAFYWLAATAPLLLLQGVWRGALQGRDAIPRFVGTFQVEMLVRLSCSWVGLALGFGLTAVCAALLISVVGSLLTSVPAQLVTQIRGASAALSGLGQVQSRSLRRKFLDSLGPAILAQMSVIVFAQLDVILVKSRTSAEAAGGFAIVVLLGRIVTFTGQVAATPMLPAVVMSKRRNEPTRPILMNTLAWVACAGLPVVCAAVAYPDVSLRLLFGDNHVDGAGLLRVYAIGAFMHAVASVLTDYGYAIGKSIVTYVAFAIGVAKLALGLVIVNSAETAVVLHLVASATLLFFTFWIVRLPQTKAFTP